MHLLQDKVCVITGGAGSIGRETATLFLAHGARVQLVDIALFDIDDLVATYGAERIQAVVADVSEVEQTRAYLRAATRFGRIDVLVSNAGNSGCIAALADYPESVFDRVIAVHVRGAFLACKYGIPAMNDGGSVIITSSVAGLRGFEGACAYAAAKHAQVGLMRSAAREAARRAIRVNTIHPGPVDNEFQRDIESMLSALLNADGAAILDSMIPLGRHATATEVAHSVLYLACDLSRFVTGACLPVDGGMSC